MSRQTEVIAHPEVKSSEEAHALARKILGKAGLNSIYMVQGSFKRSDLMDKDEASPMMAGGGVEITISASEDGRRAFADINLNAVAKPVDSNNATEFGFYVRGCYRAHYTCNEENFTNQERIESLSALIGTTAISHVWPFWREFVLQSTQRMGIPPLVVPLLFRVPR